MEASEPPFVAAGPVGPDGDREAPVAFVLSGGANLGAVQAGMLEALLEAGIVPDILVGTSIGAVNAAFLAADPSLERAQALSAVWRGLTTEDFFPLSPGLLAAALLRGGVFSADPLWRLIRREIPYRRIEEAAVPLRIVATRCERRPGQQPVSLRRAAAGLDGRAGQAAVRMRMVAARLDQMMQTAAIPVRIITTRFERRTEVAFGEGPVIDALMASCALPLVFPPYRIERDVYVDGALSEYVPLLPALDAGARVVYVLSLGHGHHEPAGHSPRDALHRSMGNRFWRSAGPGLQRALERAHSEHPGVRVVELPAPPAHVGLRDFSAVGSMIDQARDLARAFLLGSGGDLGRTA